jgi:hypothetical protein
LAIRTVIDETDAIAYWLGHVKRIYREIHGEFPKYEFVAELNADLREGHVEAHQPLASISACNDALETANIAATMIHAQFQFGGSLSSARSIERRSSAVQCRRGNCPGSR